MNIDKNSGTINKTIEKIEKEKKEKEELLYRLSGFEELSFSDKLFLLKDCGIDMRDKDFIDKLIFANIINQELKGYYKLKINEIQFIYKENKLIIPLWRSTAIIIENNEINRKPEKSIKIRDEMLFDLYFAYEEKKSLKTLQAYLKARYPYIKNGFRYLFYFAKYRKNREKEKGFRTEYNRRKQLAQESYKKRLKTYHQKENDKKYFLEMIKNDVEYFSNNGWVIRYYGFEDEQ